jgi:hypothetical protein
LAFAHVRSCMSEKELLLVVLGLVAVMMFTTGFVLATV